MAERIVDPLADFTKKLAILREKGIPEHDLEAALEKFRALQRIPEGKIGIYEAFEDGGIPFEGERPQLRKGYRTKAVRSSRRTLVNIRGRLRHGEF